MENFPAYQPEVQIPQAIHPLAESFRTQNSWNQIGNQNVEHKPHHRLSPSETEHSSSSTPELHTETQSSFHSLSPLAAPLLEGPSQPEGQLKLKEPVPHDLINQSSRFESFRQFSEMFAEWKKQHLHAFRVASSEALREPDGTINEKFKYRYVVFHCAHYGEPRIRGVGKRPKQNYLPCGCKAMLRLNYSFHEKCLKVTTLNAVHNGHEVNVETYIRVSQKIRKSKTDLNVTPYRKPVKRENVDEGEYAPATPTSVYSSTFGTPSASPMQQMLAAYHLQQHQIIASYIQQQKENLVAMHPELANQPLPPLPPLPPNVSILPPTPQFASKTTAKLETIDVPTIVPQIEDLKPKLLAPIPIRPNGAFSAFQSVKTNENSSDLSSPSNNENQPADQLQFLLKSAENMAKNDLYRFNQLQSLISSWNQQ